MTSRCKRTGHFLLCGLLAGTVLGCGDPSASDAPEYPVRIDDKPPNVVWIVLDAARAENFTPYGYERNTSPNLQELAGRGVTFEQHFAQSTFTGRSVPSYMTGRYFATSCLDLRGRVQTHRIPPAGEVLLPAILRENGYSTKMLSAHRAFIRPGSRLWNAFDESTDVKKKGSPGPFATFSDINREAFAWLDQSRHEPFFLYIHAGDTHFPHVLEPPFDRWIDPDYDAGALDSSEHGQVFWRKDGQPYTDADKAYLRALYDGSIAYADHHLGRLLDRLETQNIASRTIVIISSDHGEALGEDGATMEHTFAGSSDQVLRVPLFLAGPGIPAGRRIEALTENVDIVPTLIHLLGLETGAVPDGKSLHTLFSPGRRALREYAFAYRLGDNPDHPVLHPYDAQPAMIARSTTYKYERDPTTGAEQLWSVPDDLSRRRRVLGKRRDVAERMRQWIASERMTLWEAYLSLPFNEVRLEGTALAYFADNESAFVWDTAFDTPTLNGDGKWTVNDHFLWSGNTEDAPPVHLRYPLPEGRYRVSAWLLQGPDTDSPAALSVQIEDGEPQQLRTSIPETHETGNVEILELGETAVTDGFIDISFDDAGPDSHLLLQRFRIVPAQDALAPETAGMPPGDMLESIEAVRTLGYFGTRPSEDSEPVDDSPPNPGPP